MKDKDFYLIILLVLLFTVFTGCWRASRNIEPIAPLLYLSKADQEFACSVLIREISAGEIDTNLFGRILKDAWNDECLRMVRGAALKSLNKHAQWLATRKLISHPDPEFKDRLQSLIQSEKDSTRRVFLYGALASLGSSEAEEKLRALLRSPEVSLGDAILKHDALEVVGMLPSAKFTEEVIACLKNPTSYIRIQAIEILKKWRGCRAKDDILKMLQDPDPGVRANSIAQLGTCEDQDIVNAIAEHMTDTVSWVADGAIYWRMKSGDERGFHMLIKTFDRTARMISWSELIPYLKKFRSVWAEPLTQAVRETMKNEEMSFIFYMEYMLSALYDAGYRIPGLQDIIQEKLSAESKDMRAAACKIAGSLNMKPLAKDIRPLLMDRSQVVREAAAGALGLLRDYQSREDLEKLLQLEYVTPAQAMAARSLGKLGKSSSRVTLKKLLNDPSPWVRAEAAISLMELGDCSMVEHWLEGPISWTLDIISIQWGGRYRSWDPRLCLKEVSQHLNDPKREVRLGVLRFLSQRPIMNKE